MPVISSIIRPPEANGLDADLVSLNLDNVDNEIEDDSLPPETLSLVSFVDTLDVEQKNLHDIKAEASHGRPEPGQFGPAFAMPPPEYIIGTGLSSTVMLLIPPAAIRASTTLVAYKRYTTAHHGPTPDKKIYHWLWHELTALCHPTLRSHENICKLKHIAWEDTSVLPIIGLEFAHFGTFEDCLQDLRSYSSVDRKSDLSLDIALGLAAIHSAGLVHGDLKPRNILVTHHPSRHVVAQISDLTGVAPASFYGATEFAIVTLTWLSPEALRLHQDTDWQLADVYSFGMVFATLWSAEGFIPPGGTFLDPHMPYQLDADTKPQFIKSLKLVPDGDEGSMTKLACQSLPPTGTTGIPLRLIVKSTLCCHQRNRKPMQDMLTDCFFPWAQAVGRDMPCFSTTTTKCQPSPTSWNENLVSTVNTDCSSFTHRSAAFQANFLRVLQAAGEKIKKSLPAEKLTDLEEYTRNRWEELSGHINLVRSNSWRKSHRSQRIASALSSLGCSYIWGLGVDVDEQVGLQWFALAARLGSVSDQTTFCLFEETAERPLSAELPRKLWCAVTMFNPGDLTASKWLKEAYPDLYATVELSSKMDFWFTNNRLFIHTMYQARQQTGSSNIDIRHQQLDPHSAYAEDQRTALHLCARAGNQSFVEYLVVDKLADINATTTDNETPIFHAVRGRNLQIAKYLCQKGAETHHINEDGLTILHLLPLMDDSDAAELAPLLISGGVKLHHAAKEGIQPHLPWHAIGIPLFWAAVKCRPALFAQLLSLHSTTNQRLSVPDYKALIFVLSDFHHFDMLSLAVKAEPDVVDQDIRSANPTILLQLWQELGIEKLRVDLTHTPGSPALGSQEYTLALQLSMMQGPSFNYIRRLHHRKNFPRVKFATIKFLLSLGADAATPIKKVQGHQTALYLAIQQKDTELFSFFIDNIRSKGIEPLPILSNLDDFDGCTALQRAIDNDARGIFLFLLKTCPSLVNIPTRIGLTPLHFAAMKTWPDFARKLLSYGADPYAEDDGGLRPLERAAARNPDAKSGGEIADVIYNDSNVERDRLLGPRRRDGLTAFDTLLGSRNITVDRVERFIQQYGKPSYPKAPSARNPFFRHLLRWTSLPSHKVANAQGADVLEFLAKTFSSEINAYDEIGAHVDIKNLRLTPLQFAVSFGKVSAVEVLVKNGAELDLEVLGDDCSAGHTAVGLALVRKHNGKCPPWVLSGGRQEKELFNNDMEQILDILVRHGARTAGSGADSTTKGRLMVLVHPELRGVVNFAHPDADVHRCMRKNQGDWPRMMPWEGNGVSPLDHDVVETIQRNGLSMVSPRKDFEKLEIKWTTGPGGEPGNYANAPPNVQRIILHSRKGRCVGIEI